MILVQKPPLTQSPRCAHRRYPSAPTVVVFPTRTPGPLTLPKPPRPPLQRQTLKPLPKSKSTTVVRAYLPAEVTNNKKSVALPATPFPQQRGRGQVKHTKDRLQNHRSNSPSPSPPSRKSANYKQHTPSSLVHSKAIPVPVATRRQTPNISRSDPLPSHIHRRPHPISALPSTSQHFPICDDMNDSADLSVPTTPPPTRRDHYNNLQTATVPSRTSGAFPLNAMGFPSSPSPLTSKRKHRRTPSEGVFHMSSDEDLSSGPDGTILNPNVQALFGLVNTFKPSSKVLPSAFSTPVRLIPPFKKDSASPSCSLQSKCEAGYFASSMFQNSPSPEELPDPPIF